MADLADAISEAAEKGRESKLNAAVAIAVALSATFMALSNVKDGNICQAMAQDQSKAVDAWSYYQAKGTKENIATSVADQLTLMRDASTLTPEQKGLYDAKIADYQAKAKQYEDEKSKIKDEATGYQQDYDALNVHDDQFDMSDASFSVALSLFGITALTGKRALFAFATLFAFAGFVLGAAGFLHLDLHPDWLAGLLG